MKSEKRPFDRLTDGEKKILHDLHEASHRETNLKGVSASGPLNLAQRLTPEKKLSSTDPVSLDCVHLLREGWIVLGPGNSIDRTRLYTVSNDYLAQLADHS